jgi:hypothetical protein
MLKKLHNLCLLNSIFAFLATRLMDRALYWRTRTTPTNSVTLAVTFTLTRMRTGGSTQLTSIGESVRRAF